MPMFDIRMPPALMLELKECRKVYGDHYIGSWPSTPAMAGRSVRLSFIVNRPAEEPGFRLERQEAAGRISATR